MDGIEVVLDDGSSRVVRRNNVFVQFRHGKLTVAALDRMLASFHAIARTTTGPIFAIFVIAEDAEVPNATVRARQKDALAEIARDERLHTAVVIEGEGLLAYFGRSIATTMAPGTACFRDVGAAARELARVDGSPSASELLSVAMAARR